jgi:hypothetical protein
MLETTVAHIALSFFLAGGEPQLGFDHSDCIVVQDDWTGCVSFDDWSPATGDTMVVDDHVRRLAQDAARYADALSEFGIDPRADAIAEAFMKRTAPANVPKRKLARK